MFHEIYAQTIEFPTHEDKNLDLAKHMTESADNMCNIGNLKHQTLKALTHPAINWDMTQLPVL